MCFSISSVVSITPHLLLGQTARATVLGVVKDTSGAVIPKAAITVLNQATGVVHRTTTSASGNYVIPALLPGTYSITASKSGFQTRTETGEALTVTARLAVSFTLPLGQVTQQVTVSAAAVHLDTASASLGQVIDQKAITTLPLNGRDFVQLTSLGVGTTPVINSRQDEGSARVKGETIGVNVSGGRGAWT
ncbi:MAG: carboxypeptidase-like regulatory domain-containing protein, partial [Ktedonobacteraceae bacterium]